MGQDPHCRVCKIKNRCPDCYDVDSPVLGDWVRDWDRLAEITEEVTGTPRDLCLYNSDKDTFDNGIAVIEYDNDIRATYTLNVVSARTTRQLRLLGTEGSLEADLETGKVSYWKRYSDDKESIDVSSRMNSGHGGADDEIFRDFFDCCRKRRKPISSWPEGRLALEVGLAARQSCDTGGVIELLSR